MYAPRPTRTRSSASVERSPRILPSPPPGVDTRTEDEGRYDQQRQQVDPVLLRGGQRNPSIVGLFGPYGDEILLLGQPADRVHEQIAVALDAKTCIGHEIRVADHSDPGLGLGLRRRLDGIRGGRRS